MSTKKNNKKAANNKDDDIDQILKGSYQDFWTF